MNNKMNGQTFFPFFSVFQFFFFPVYFCLFLCYYRTARCILILCAISSCCEWTKVKRNSRRKKEVSRFASGEYKQPKQLLTNFRVDFLYARHRHTNGWMNDEEKMNTRYFTYLVSSGELKCAGATGSLFRRYLIKRFNYLLGSMAKELENWTDINTPHTHNTSIYGLIHSIHSTILGHFEVASFGLENSPTYYIFIYIWLGAICLAMIYIANLWPTVECEVETKFVAHLLGRLPVLSHFHSAKWACQ